jgi:diguanylate cyclase (GGDEF)-like protein
MNRRAFDETIELEIRGHRRGEPPVLLLIDIDLFKAINDDYGHQAGDEVIRQVGRVLQANLRAGDTVSRYAGKNSSCCFATCGLTARRRLRSGSGPK